MKRISAPFACKLSVLGLSVLVIAGCSGSSSRSGQDAMAADGQGTTAVGGGADGGPGVQPAGDGSADTGSGLPVNTIDAPVAQDGGGSVPMICSPGDTRVCVGPGACAGGQSCLPSGTWTACDCGTPTGGTPAGGTPAGGTPAGGTTGAGGVTGGGGNTGSAGNGGVTTTRSTGTIVTGGTRPPVAGRLSSTGGAAGTTEGGALAGTTAGGTVAGAAAGTTAGGGAGTTATGGTVVVRPEGPCDIYKAGNTPCAAAYSMVRALSKTYNGPLYQVRTGSSSTNTGSGGTLHDIGMTADGYADSAAHDAICANTVCSVSKLYDQSGNSTHLIRAPKGPSGNGPRTAEDCYEALASAESLTAGGHKVYSLYTHKYSGYRYPAKGAKMPPGTAAQGIYMLADGKHVDGDCCFDFGNVAPDPMSYHTSNALFFGTAFWGRGAGTGPWFEADFEGGIWAGGALDKDPGASDGYTKNPNNPALKVAFALGVLKTTTPKSYTIRVADAKLASDLTLAYEGPGPKEMDNQGCIVLGVGANNENNSAGTFYEGAITIGAPSVTTDLAVLKNIQAVGYTK